MHLFSNVLEFLKKIENESVFFDLVDGWRYRFVASNNGSTKVSESGFDLILEAISVDGYRCKLSTVLRPKDDWFALDTVSLLGDAAPNMRELVEIILCDLKKMFLIYSATDEFFCEQVGKPDSNTMAIPQEVISTAGPSISLLEEFYCKDAVRNGWNKNWDNYIRAFEDEGASIVNSAHALATSSCTGAMHIALLALGLEEGDEVLVPDQTWVSTGRVVELCGGVPVFCDIEPCCWGLDPRKIKDRISEKTKGIIAVHAYGVASRISEISAIAKANNLFLIEDAAPAMGASVNGLACGSWGDFGCFSFQGAKMLVAGEGGLLVTSNSELARKARKIADFGRDPNKTFWIDAPGLKYKMSNVQASLALAQCLRIEDQIAKKITINKWYREFLRDCEEIVFQTDSSVDASSVYWMTSVRLSMKAKCTRELLMNGLKKAGIDTRPSFPQLSSYPFWRSKETLNQRNEVAESVSIAGLNLPSGVLLGKDQVRYICHRIKDTLAHV